MLRKLRPGRPSHGTVVAYLGLFVALGGTAYAVNTVGSTDIIDGQVKSVDIGNNEIGSSDVKDNSLNTFDVHSFLGADVVDDSLTGADVQESSLGKVPSSGNADTLDGQTLSQVRTSIVARPSGDADVAGGNPAVAYPLSGNTWTQPAGSVQFIYGQATVDVPSDAACNPAPNFDAQGVIRATVVLEPFFVGGFTNLFAFFPGVGTHEVSLSTIANQTGPLYSPDSATTRTLNATVFDPCQDQHYRLQSARFYVVEHR